MTRRYTLLSPLTVLACVLLASSPGLAQPIMPPPGGLSDAAASAIAVNDLSPQPGGVLLDHPSHSVAFGPTGLDVRGTRGGPAWRWSLTAIRSSADAGTHPAVHHGPTAPTRGRASDATPAVRYDRGAVVEEYLARATVVEQRFVVRAPLALRGGDLVVEGRVASEGAFEARDTGWQWATEAGAVTLGDVTVFDARGRTLPAVMTVDADRTTISVDGAALAAAAYPVTIDPEIGTNDVRISDAGGTGNSAFDARDPSVAWNATANEYLVVWEANDTDATGVVSGEFEIFGQRLDATGAEVGTNDVRISDAGGTGNSAFGARDPSVAWNATANEYLVVWEADDTDATGVVDNELEIFGQRLDATGAEVGTNDFRISDAGGSGSASFNARDPSVAWNETANEYLVVWEADDFEAGVDDNEYEIFGQRLDATGAEVGTNDFRISDTGGSFDASSDAEDPSVVWNATANEYLVVWQADDTDVTGVVSAEDEIFGQRLDATGAEVGTNDFRISDAGGTGNSAFDARDPSVAWNATANEYLVVWQADDTDVTGVVSGEDEIFGQRLNATGAEVGTNDFRISDAGGTGNSAFDAQFPSVAWNATANEYLVVWHADDTDATGVVDNEREIFGQRLDATGAEIGTNDVRISDAGGSGSTSALPQHPSVAWNATANEYLVVWHADDTDAPGVVDNEVEIFGQRLGFGSVLSAAVGADFYMLAAPGPAPTLDQVLGPLWTQGFPGSDAPTGGLTVFTYDETVAGVADDGYTVPAGQTSALAPGTGFFAYVFADDDASTGGVQGGFPKTLSAPAVAPTGDVAPVLSCTAPCGVDDGWHLLGNPFFDPVDANAFTFGTGVATTVSVYDPTVPEFKEYDTALNVGGLTDGIIGAYQGFFVQATVDAATLTMPTSAVQLNGTFRGLRPAVSVLALEVTGEAGPAATAVRADTYVAFSENGLVGRDGSDAGDLTPPAATYARLYSRPVAPFDGDADLPLAIQSLPGELPDGGLVVRLGLEAVVGGTPEGGAFEFTWPRFDVPDDWAFTLRDATTGAEVDLRTATSYAFDTAAEVGDRFSLLVAPVSAVAADDSPMALGLALTVGPNPAATRATLRYHVPAAGPASVAVYDALGREVTQLTDGPHASGWHTVGLDAGRLAPGTYLVRLTGAAGSAVGTLSVVR